MTKYQLLLSYTRQYKAIFKENLVFYLGFVAIAPLTTLSRYFHALTSKFQAQFCSQSDKLESEAKLINYFIWCLSHFSSLPCLTMYKYCEGKITLYVSFLGIILAVFSLDFTLENIETLAKKIRLFSSVPHPKNYYNHVTSLNHQHYYYHDKLFNESRPSYKWDLTTLLNGNSWKKRKNRKTAEYMYFIV